MDIHLPVHNYIPIISYNYEEIIILYTAEQAENVIISECVLITFLVVESMRSPSKGQHLLFRVEFSAGQVQFLE